MIGYADQELRMYNNQITEGTFLQNCVDSVLLQHKPRQWEGFIHASRLDWNKEPHKQLSGSMNPGGASVELLRYSRTGELYHNDLQRLLDTRFGENSAWVEQHIQIDDINFRGTPDRVQFNTPIGTVLMEFKTTNTYSRDKADGERILRRLLKCKHLGDQIVISPTWSEHEKEIQERLCVRRTPITSKSDHETQLFTYGWILQAYYGIKVDHYMLAYVHRESYQTREFWWSADQAQEKVYRAYLNYSEVLKCLQDHQARTNGSQLLTSSM